MKKLKIFMLFCEMKRIQMWKKRYDKVLAHIRLDIKGSIVRKMTLVVDRLPVLSDINVNNTQPCPFLKQRIQNHHQRTNNDEEQN